MIKEIWRFFTGGPLSRASMHRLGLCRKSQGGYNCKGRNNYEECGY